MTTLHLMLAIALFALGVGCICLYLMAQYWFRTTLKAFPAGYKIFVVFGICTLLASIAIGAVSVFYKGWLMKGRRNMMLRVIEVGLTAAASIIFLVAGQKIPAAIFGVVTAMIAVATIWEARKPAPQEVVIDEDGITLPRRGVTSTVRWVEIEGVILRHSILSIELSGNKLIQRSIAQGADPDVPTIEAFSKTHIRKHEKQRVANAAW